MNWEKNTDRKERFALTLLVLLILVHIVLWIRRVAGVFTFPYPLDYHEGVVLFWARQAANHAPLYPEIYPGSFWIHNPYTPLFAWLGASLRVLDRFHIFLAGRVVAFISFIVCFVLVTAISRRKAGKAAGYICGILFLFSPLAGRYGTLVMPDMTALAFSLGAFWVIEHADKKWSIHFSALLASCAVGAKQVFFASPITCALLAFSRNRRTFLIWMALFFAFTATAIFISGATGRNHLFQHLVVFNILPFSIRHFLSIFSLVAGRHALLFVAMAMFLADSRRQKEPLWIYAVFSLVVVLLSAKPGAEENYYLEFIALASIAGGIILAETAAKNRRVVYMVCIAQLFLFLPFKPAAVFTRTYGQEIPATSAYTGTGTAEREIGQIIIAEILSATGDVLCEDIGFLEAAGAGVLVEPYQFAQLAEAGRLDDSFLVESIREHRFSLVVLSADSMEKKSQFFTARTLSAIKENYIPRRIVGNWYICEPKTYSQ